MSFTVSEVRGLSPKPPTSSHHLVRSPDWKFTTNSLSLYPRTVEDESWVENCVLHRGWRTKPGR